jgi:hypothetical protein
MGHEQPPDNLTVAVLLKVAAPARRPWRRSWADLVIDVSGFILLLPNRPSLQQRSGHNRDRSGFDVGSLGPPGRGMAAWPVTAFEQSRWLGPLGGNIGKFPPLPLSGTRTTVRGLNFASKP